MTKIFPPQSPAEEVIAMASPLVLHLGGFPARGATITTPGGGVGRYVGSLLTGTDWIAYEQDDYPSMRDAFRRAECASPERSAVAALKGGTA